MEICSLRHIFYIILLTTGQCEMIINTEATLKMDEALLTVRNQMSYGLQVLYTSDYCYQCLYQPLASMEVGPGNVSVVLSTPFTLTLKASPVNATNTLCSISYLFEEAGHYSLWVTPRDALDVTCHISLDKFPHSTYQRLTIADLVMPCSMRRKGVTRLQLLRKLSWRTVVLMLIGFCFINYSPRDGLLSWSWLRIPGVLQRLAFTYFILSLMQMFSPYREIPPSQVRWWSPVQDVVLYWPEWIFILLLETVWLCVTFLLPVPHCPTGYLGAGGIGDNALYPNCTGGAAAYIDRWLLGHNIYWHPTCKAMYHTTQPFDPEGVLGTINSIVMGFIGMQAGKIFLFYRKLNNKIIIRFSVWAVILGILAAILSKCTRDSGFIPVNKNLWSLSYVACMGSMSFVLLGVMYFVVDIKGWWGGQPFIYPGMNSILVYVGHSLLGFYFPFSWEMRYQDSHWEPLFQSLWGTALWIFITYLLYHKRFFLKI
ncbi:heparan-alpha-glucosaminide N-acetyltransferase isoform X7 [Pangasianodon hypophthalmus]|uniref:heparan-alpha-glucosaminide N-acetyltransferase isoform X7 n=1 Tax=Pangasianodon hypophthalmus TaxID=310915 RepID=UPI00147E163C|nr:heparan-alpha-glucosaminide N-acetyltransferase isoform X7 [Pangasianodon hypophthalmus]